MRAFIKYFLIGCAAQVLLGVILMSLGSVMPSSAPRPAEALLYLYVPFMFLVAATMNPGKAQMINAGLLGALLGILFYGAVIGLAASAYKKKRDRSNAVGV